MKARENRETVEALCRFRSRAGVSWPVLIEDLTTGGCLITCVPLTLRQGERITVTIGDLAPIGATVRWVKTGQAAGLQFDLRLLPSTFRNLLSDLRGMPDPFVAAIPAKRPRKPMYLRV